MRRLALAALIGLAVVVVAACRWEQDERLPNMPEDWDGGW